jgi:hypothetical protein
MTKYAVTFFLLTLPIFLSGCLMNCSEHGC